ncbi:hypothetical protein GBA52_021642 [Prunus armeniaca]|nr:hypothetical protein GBA52_021642 [Prunus armeniaca]
MYLVTKEVNKGELQGISALDFDRKEDEAKRVVHLSLPQQLVFVRWNLANQDEICSQSFMIRTQPWDFEP